jgi:acyl dehydratase
MGIDMQRALAARTDPHTATWTQDDVILYHLGIGAGQAPAESELSYVFEDALRVLPTFAVLAPKDATSAAMRLPGLDIDWFGTLHGEHEIVVSKPIPPAATVSSRGRVARIDDKGSAAVVVIETETTDENDEVLFLNRFSLFVRGAGGFGGDRGPTTSFAAPDREPDRVLDVATFRAQALLYRLSGDKTRLHVDPEAARRAGFDRPILHGMCTYGVVAKAIVDTLAAGDVERLRRYSARFTGVVYPGDTIRLQAWQDGSEVAVAASTGGDAPVLSGRMTLEPA